MGPQVALDYINAATQKTYQLGEQYPGSESQSVYRVMASDNSPAVLKVNDNPQWLKQIEKAKAATDHLRTLGYPAPAYLHIGSNDSGTYTLQTALPGEAGEPTPARIANLIKTIELQKGQVISEVSGQDWVWYMTDVVFRGESGHVRTLMQFSPETSALVSAILGMVAGLSGKVLPKTDLVHGDMAIKQVLFTGDEVTGVLDWDQVGYGDRTSDYVSLWYSILQAPEARDVVMQHMLSYTDKDVIKIHAAYRLLTLVAWNITKGRGDVAPVAMLARTAVDQLQAL